tara:strand:- start:1 stop:1452 length:1452 start_codon:yes stop_codon:yes gene_type:complete
MALTKATSNMIEGAQVNVLDYGAVGDGVTDDSSAIQLALNQQGNIYFPDGTYIVKTTLTVKSNTCLFGSKNATIDGSTPTSITNATIFNIVEKEDVTVRGLSFIYDTDVATACSMFTFDGSDRIRIYDNTFTSEDGSTAGNTAAVRIRETVSKGSNDVVISGNYFEGPRLLILTQGGSGQIVKDVIISNNTFSQNSDIAENPNFLDGAVKIDLGTDNVVFSGNTCDGNNKTEGFLQVEETINNVTVTGNVINNCLGYGIFIYGGQTLSPVNNVTIIGNVLSNAGIYVADLGTSSAGEIIISNNVVDGTQNLTSGPTVSGIDCQFGTVANIVISNNIIKNPTGYGIINRYGNVVISNNNIINPVTYGIFNRYGNNNNINNNSINLSGASSSYGIGLRQCTGGLVTGNKVYGVGASINTGIIFLDVERSTVQNNFVDLATATYGVYIDANSNKINVSNNTSSGATPISNSATNSVSNNNVDMDTI